MPDDALLNDVALADRETSPAAAPSHPAAAVEPLAARRRQWSIATLAYGGAALLVFFILRDTVATLIEKWWTVGTYGHGFLIVPTAVYLAWRQRHRLLADPIRPAPAAGLMAATVAAGLWLLGRVGSVVIVEQVALIAILQALALAVFGWAALRKAAFPLLFLYFAVPVGEFLIPDLQTITAQASVFLLRASGIPVYLDGLNIQLPGGHFVVAEACAGLRYLIATLPLGFLVAFLFFRTWPRRLAFITLCAIVPILANAVRAYGVMLLAHLTNFRIAVDVDHIIYGWFFFSLVTAGLLAVGYAMREPATTPEATALAAAVGPGADDPPQGRATAKTVLTAAATVLPVALLAAYADNLDRHQTAAPVTAAWQQFRPQAPWQPAAPDTSWQPGFRGADREVRLGYADGPDQVDLYVAIYDRQRQGAEIISQMNSLEDNADWHRIDDGSAAATLGGQALSVRRVTFSSTVSDEQVRTVWAVSCVDGTLTADPLLGKLLGIRASLWGRLAAAEIAIAATTTDPGRARPILQRFLDHADGVRALCAATR